MISSRRNFIGQSAFAIFGITPMLKLGMDANAPVVDPIPSRYPSTHYDDVREIVGAAHSDYDLVKELVDKRPELAKATYDWGFGDWESALGAASHMGRKDIAELLIDHGARPNLFTLAMLGKLEAVRSSIDAIPGIQSVRGPHGLTLLFHAQMRLRRKNVEGIEKEKQEALVEYLQSVGDADQQEMSKDISSDEQEIYLGRYDFGKGENEFFEVTLNSRNALFLQRGTFTGRMLKRIDQHSFAPGGAPSVKIHFEVVDGLAQTLTIHDPVPILSAQRI